MPRSTQGWSGSSRRQCRTSPSWRPLITSSTNSKGSRPSPSLRPLSPSPCRRVSPRHPRQGRRKRRLSGGGLGPSRPRLLNQGRSPSSRCRISSNRHHGRLSKGERRRHLPAASRRSSRSRHSPASRHRGANPGSRHRRGGGSRDQAAGIRPRKRNRRRRSGRGRRSSNGAWPRWSFWGSPPDYGYGLPSLVACSAPVRLPGSQAPNRPIMARQPPPIQTTRGAGRQTACPAPPN